MFLSPKADWICSALILTVAQLLWGCASSPRAQDNGRRGLFDRGDSVSPLRAGREAIKEDDDLYDSGNNRDQAHGPSAFRWPLRSVTLTSGFGKRGVGEFHEGVDLRAPMGTPVYAAHDAKVIYAGNRIRGYGRLVVLKDSHGFSTIYAHNSKLLVVPGQRVRQGDKLALSGNSGTSSGPHLHFEIRRGTQAKDPMLFLPDTGVAALPTRRQSHAARVVAATQRVPKRYIAAHKPALKKSKRISHKRKQRAHRKPVRVASR